MAFTAKYNGNCYDCDDPILVGDRVEFDDDRNLRHVLCPDETFIEDGRSAAKQVCPQCFLVMVKGHHGWYCGSCDE